MYCALVLLAASLAADAVPAENGRLKKNDFVNVLKQKLRKNNDDYAEMEKNKFRNSNKTDSVASTRKDLAKVINEERARPANYNITGEVNRRGGAGVGWEFDYNEVRTESSPVDTKPDIPVRVTKEPLRKRKENYIPINKLYHLKKNISNLIDPSVPRLKSTIKAVNSISKFPELINKKRIDKFKKFVYRNKNLFKELLSTNFQTQPKNVEFETTDKNVLRNDVKKSERAREDDKDQLPTPDLLDMAPAKGGRIHHLRLKGRLCQRHVLVPEGPKYDSAGRWYVPQHRSAARWRHAYGSSPRPRLLLPRCCNCCKKSVLGCE